MTQTTQMRIRTPSQVVTNDNKEGGTANDSDSASGSVPSRHGDSNSDGHDSDELGDGLCASGGPADSLQVDDWDKCGDGKVGESGATALPVADTRLGTDANQAGTQGAADVSNSESDDDW